MSYTQEDIDKIIICREAIDKHRSFNQARVKALTVAKSVYEAKAMIELKLDKSTTIATDASMKSTDEIKKILESERTKSTLEMYEILGQQGFTGATLTDNYYVFAEWYKKKIIEIYRDCCPIRGICDLCGEKELNEQPCTKLGYSKEALMKCAVYKWEDEKTIGNTVYEEAFRRSIRGETKEVDGITIVTFVCPKGHGYWNDPKDYKPVPDGIDFSWRV